MSSEDTVRLRNLLAGVDLTHPSRAAWLEVEALFRHARGAPEDLATLVSELEAALAPWPDDLLVGFPFLVDDPAQRPFARLYRTICVDSTALEGADLQALFGRWPGMKVLALDEVFLSEEAWEVLCAPPEGARLSAVSFIRCELDDARLAFLLSSPLGARLTWLGLCGGELSDPALGTIFAEPRRLEGLFLAEQSLGAVCAAELARGQLASTLRELELSSVNLAPEVVQTLRTRAWPALEHLTLGELRLEPGWMVPFAQAPLLRGLTELNLGRAPLGTGGVEALAGAPFERLRALTLHGLTNRGASALAGASWTAGLRQLRIIRGELDARAIAALRAALPEGTLTVG